MLRERRDGLVAFYDIRPGNGAGLFLQPGARTGRQPRIHSACPRLDSELSTLGQLSRSRHGQWSALVSRALLVEVLRRRVLDTCH